MIMSILKLRKRLFRNNGSVLFIVLVVMSMLIIAATVTYYIVNNQNASVEVHYASEQSYQTARSLLSTADKFLSKQFDAMAGSGDSLQPYKDTLAGRMISMAVNTTIETTPIDLKDMGLGDAKMTIKRVNGMPSADPDTLNQYYEVTVNAEVNGESASVTQVRLLQVGTSTYFTRFLTCTGKRGEDVRIGAGQIFGQSYFENEYTEWLTSNPSKLNDSLYSYGSVMDYGIQYMRPTDSTQYMEAVIKENYILGSSAGTKVDVPFLFVGNDLYNGSSMADANGKEITSDAVYVLGDYYKYGNQNDSSQFFIGGDCHLENGNSSSTFYVNGDAYLFTEPSGGGLSNQGTLYVNGNVYVGDRAKWSTGQFANIYYSGQLLDQNGNPIGPLAKCVQDSTVSATIAAALPASNTAANIQSFTGGINSMEDYIRNKTTKNTYKAWNAETYFNNNLLSDAEEVSLTSSGEIVTTTSNAVVLNSMETQGTKLIVDATSDDVYVYLKGITDADGKKRFNVKTQSDIIVKGQHAVILILPEDTDFKMESQCVIGNSALLAGCSNTQDADDFETSISTSLNALDIDKAKSVMHVEGDINDVGGYKIPADDSVTKINESTVPGGSNSIFLVTTGNSNLVDLTDQCCLAGYLYAPNGRMLANGSSGKPQVIGGLIAGSYSYSNPSTGLVFAQPYDYANGSPNIVARLISEANDGGSGSDLDDVIFKGASVIGYK